MKVKQIRCSSCGGPISLETDAACKHCGAAISVLDEGAVEKALSVLHAREVQRSTIDPVRMTEALLASEASARRARLLSGVSRKQAGPLEWLGNTPSTGGLADLVELGIGSALAALLRD